MGGFNWPFRAQLEKVIIFCYSVMNGGPQSKKRLITRSPMCGLLVEPTNFPFGTYLWPQSMKNAKIRSNFHEKMAVFSHYLAINGKLWVRKKFPIHIWCQRWSGKRFMKIGCSAVPKPTYPSLLCLAEWKKPAPFTWVCWKNHQDPTNRCQVIC